LEIEIGEKRRRAAADQDAGANFVGSRKRGASWAGDPGLNSGILFGFYLRQQRFMAMARSAFCFWRFAILELAKVHLNGLVIGMADWLGLAGKSSGRAQNQWTNALAMPNLRRK